MPLPIVGGIVSGIGAFLRPFLAKWGGKLLTKLFSGFSFFGLAIWEKVKVFFDRAPFFIAWSLAVLALLMGLKAFYLSQLVGLFPPIPLPIAQAAGWFLPSNTSYCISIVYASKLYRFLFDYNNIVLRERLHTFGNK